MSKNFSDLLNKVNEFPTKKLSVAAANDVDVLVLGACGCGAFNNPPELVADEFYELVVKIGFGRFFRKVIFAIKSDGERGKANYEAFASRFKDD